MGNRKERKENYRERKEAIISTLTNTLVGVIKDYKNTDEMSLIDCCNDAIQRKTVAIKQSLPPGERHIVLEAYKEYFAMLKKSTGEKVIKKIQVCKKCKCPQSEEYIKEDGICENCESLSAD